VVSDGDVIRISTVQRRHRNDDWSQAQLLLDRLLACTDAGHGRGKTAHCTSPGDLLKNLLNGFVQL